MMIKGRVLFFGIVQGTWYESLMDVKVGMACTLLARHRR
jgi:hypothetical protein